MCMDRKIQCNKEHVHEKEMPRRAQLKQLVRRVEGWIR